MDLDERAATLQFLVTGSLTFPEREREARRLNTWYRVYFGLLRIP
jgi:hypothetical protein